MKYFRPYLCGTAALALGALSGCGGGGGGTGQATVGTSGTTLTRAQTQLNGLSSGSQEPSATVLQSTATLFQSAEQQSPDSSAAHFGRAIALAGLLSLQDDPNGIYNDLPPDPPVVSIGGGVNDPPPSPPGRSTQGGRDITPMGTAGSGSALQLGGSLPPAPPGAIGVQPLPSPRALGLIWNLSPAVSNPNLLLHILAPLADFRTGYLPFFANYGRTIGVDDPASRQQLLANLATVAQELAKVEADPNFTYALPTADANGATRTVGLAEVYLFDAYISSLQTKVALSLAYRHGVDPADAPPIAPGAGQGTVGGYPALRKPADLDMNHDGKLTPQEYLAPSPFLTLRSATYLTTAKTALLATADRETKGISLVLARKDGDTSFLVPNTANIRTQLTTVRDTTLPILRQAAIGPITVQEPYLVGTPINLPAPGGMTSSGTTTTAPPIIKFQSVTINLAAWFAAPPADLKAFAPTYTLTTDGYVDATKTTYPDATFGGLYPNGLPKTGLF